MTEKTEKNVKTFRDLFIWQKSMELVTEIYKVSKTFPKSEWYGLTAQMRRSAISIPSNISEGFGRNSPNDFVRFLLFAAGSLYELQTQIELSCNLGYMNTTDFDTLYKSTREIERMLTSFIRSIQEQQ